jgi:hypothetical protein
MYYKEMLRVRYALFVLTPVMAGFVAIQLIYNLAHGALRSNVDPAGHPLSTFFAASGLVASIVAGIFAIALGNENDGHLEQAWTKPASRNFYALTLFAVDVGGILAAFVLSLVAHMYIHYLEGSLRLINVDANAWPSLALYLILPLAWYGLVVALTASLRTSSKMVAGLSWVGALVLVGLSYLKLPDIWASLVKTVNYLNPIAYAAYLDPAQAVSPFPIWQANAAALLGICILGVIAALVQWRKAEA